MLSGSLLALFINIIALQINHKHSVLHEKQPRIIWNNNSLTRVAEGGYARIIQLTDNKLFCVYEVAGNIAFVKSKDLGKSWSKPEIIIHGGNGINMSTPDVIELHDSTLLVAYNPRPKNGNADTSKRFAIRVTKSNDNGKSWTNDQRIYRAGYQFKNGCWEPALIQLPNGEIQLFFSNEGIYKHSDEQNISLFCSEDNGLHWSATPEIASFTPDHRDGMPVPVILPKKKKFYFPSKIMSKDNLSLILSVTVLRKTGIRR